MPGDMDRLRRKDSKKKERRKENEEKEAAKDEVSEADAAGRSSVMNEALQLDNFNEAVWQTRII